MSKRALGPAGGARDLSRANPFDDAEFTSASGLLLYPRWLGHAINLAARFLVGHVSEMTETPPYLRLAVLTQEQPILAREAGLMIERIANAFDQAVRSQQIEPGGRLELRELRLGSLYADLGMLAFAYTVWEQRSALAAFISFLSDSLTVLTSLKGGSVPPAHRSMFEAFAAPVARGHATQVNFFLLGDNENGIEIKPEMAELIMAAVARPRSLGPETYALREAESPRIALRPLVMQDAVSLSQVQAITREGVEELTSGTMRSIDGTWYVRPVGLDGVLLPADYDGNLKPGPISTFQYMVEGEIVSHSGMPSRFRVRSIVRNNGPTPRNV